MSTAAVLRGVVTVDGAVAAEGQLAALDKRITKLGIGGTSSLSKLGAIAKVAFVGLGAAAAVGVGKAVSSFVTLAGQTRTLSRLLGISIEDASRLRVAAETLGISTDDLARAFGIFSKHLVDGGAAFLKYGISLRDASGQNKTFNQILAETADKFVSMPPGVERTAFALDVFGRSGKTLIPLLAKGSAGIADLEKEADRLGLTMSEKDVAAARQLAIAQRQLGEAFQGAEVSIAKVFVPAITTAVRWVTSGVAVFTKLPGPLKAGAAAVLILSGAFVGLGLTVGVVSKSLASLGIASAGLGPAVAAGAAGFAALGAAIALGIPLIREWTTSAGDLANQFGIGEQRVKDMQDQLNGFVRGGLTVNRVKDAIAVYNEELAKAREQGLSELQISQRMQAGWGKAVEVLGGWSGNYESFGAALDHVLGIEARTVSTTARLAAEYADATAKARELYATELQLAGGFLGIEGAALSAKQANLSYAQALEQLAKDKKDSHTTDLQLKQDQLAVQQALLGRVQSQQSLAASIADYIKQQQDAGVKTKDVTALVWDYGRKAGLTHDQIQSLVGQVKDLIGQEGKIPPSIKTQFVTPGLQTAYDTARLYSGLLASIPSTISTRFRTAYQLSQTKSGLAEGAITRAATGLIARTPTLIGDSTIPTFAGRGIEANLPLDSRGIRILSKALSMAMREGRVGGDGGVHLHFHAPVYGMPDFRRQVGDAMKELVGGRTPR